MDDVEVVAAEWRFLCSGSGGVGHVPAEGEHRPLIETAIHRSRPNSDRPSSLLEAHASAFGAERFEGDVQETVVILGHLASAIERRLEDVDAQLVKQVGDTIMARGAQAAFRAWRDRAENDSLTDLPNRRSLDAFLDGYEPLGTEVVEVAMIDLDGLKEVNDVGGHDEGDRYILLFARELDAACTAVNATAYRYGGDEFAVILRNADEEDLGQALLDLQQRLDADDGSARFSYGTHREEMPSEEHYEEWLKAADEALYENKRARKGEAEVCGCGATLSTDWSFCPDCGIEIPQAG